MVSLSSSLERTLSTRERKLRQCATTNCSWYDKKANDSLYQTIATHNVYFVHLLLNHLTKNKIDLASIEASTRQKAAKLYDVIDKSAGFYVQNGPKTARSINQISFRLANPNLYKKLIEEIKSNGLEASETPCGIVSVIVNYQTSDATVSKLVSILEKFVQKAKL